jgi:hypothetical protein
MAFAREVNRFFLVRVSAGLSAQLSKRLSMMGVVGSAFCTDCFCVGHSCSMTKIKSKTGARCGSRFERAKELVSSQLATSDPDESDQAGAEERK